MAVLKGLQAYNFAAKFVSLALKEQEVKLKKGRYFSGSTVECSYRDLVNRVFQKSKGKTKAEIERIALSEIEDCVSSLNAFKLKEANLPSEGTGYDFSGIPYWMLSEFLDYYQLDQKISLDNTVLEDVESFNGRVSDLSDAEGNASETLSDIISQMNTSPLKEFWDSDTMPTYSGYVDSKGVAVVVLNYASIEGAVDTAREARESLLSEGIGRTGGAVSEKSEKPLTAKEKAEIAKIEAETEGIKADNEKKKSQANKAKIDELKSLQEYWRAEKAEAKEDDDKEALEEAKIELKKIKAKIKKLM